MIADDQFQFVDTNILVYAHDLSSGEKHNKAKALLDELWNTGMGCLSIQVLQEFYVTITQKVAKPLDSDIAAQRIRDLTFWNLHTPGSEDILGAINFQQRYRISFWDAMILWSAQQLGCDTLWSEDLNPGQEYAGLVVENPFV